jgi:hypothetical protein
MFERFLIAIVAFYLRLPASFVHNKLDAFTKSRRKQSCGIKRQKGRF